MKSRPAWSKLSSAQLSTATPWAGRPYQLFRFHGKQRRHAGALVVAEVVPAHLAVVVREPVRIRLRLREQQEPRRSRRRSSPGARPLPAGSTRRRRSGSSRRSRGLALSTSSVVTCARVTTLRRPVACAFGIVVTAVEFFASTWQPPRLQKPWYMQAERFWYVLGIDGRWSGKRMPAERSARRRPSDR